MRRLLFLLLTLIASAAFAQKHVPTSATLPTSTPDKTYPSTVNTVKTVCPSGCDYTTVSAAWSAAQTNRATWLTTEIKIDRTQTYTSGVSIALSGCVTATEIIFRTDSASMPAQGTRVTSGDFANMPIIRTNTNNTPVFTVAPSSCGFRFFGLNVTSSVTGGGLIEIGTTGTSQDTAAEIPDDIWVDRSRVSCDEADNATQACDQAVVLYAKNSGVVDSHLAGIKNSSEAKSILIVNTTGNLLIENNYIEATGMGWMVGGASLPTTGEQYQATNLTFRRNRIRKNPAWQDDNPVDWTEKNMVEFKHGRKVLVEGNIFENGWPDGQEGQCIEMNNADSSGNNPWLGFEDFTIRYNICRNTEGFFMSLNTTNGVFPTLSPKRITVYDNLVDGASNGNQANGAFGNPLAGACMFAACSSLADTDRIITSYFAYHNTSVPSSRINASFRNGFAILDVNVPLSFSRSSSSFAMHDNVIGIAREGATSNDHTGYVNCKINGVRDDTKCYSHDYNSFWGNLLTNAGASACITSTIDVRPLAPNGVGCATTQGSQFTTFSAANIGTGNNNYKLLNTSPGYQAASDASGRTAAGLSTDVGADMTKLSLETCGVVSGNWSCYTGLPAPTVSAITPATGGYLGGTSITDLAGTGFQAGATVSIGGVSCTSPSVVTSIKMTCTTGAHAAGIVNVVVTNPDAQSGTLTNGYEYTGSGPPTISSVITTQTGAARGSTFGSYILTITGTNFGSGAAATVGSQSCDSLIVVNSTTITCTVPRVNVPAIADVTVTNLDTQAATLTNGFTYTKPVVAR